MRLRAGGVMSEDMARTPRPNDSSRDGNIYDPRRTDVAWWAWHDADATRWSLGAPDKATEDAERRCAAWIARESDDGPELDAPQEPDQDTPADQHAESIAAAEPMPLWCKVVVVIVFALATLGLIYFMPPGWG